MEAEYPAAQAHRGEVVEAVRTLLKAVGEDVDREGLRDTPLRYWRALQELTTGYGDDPAVILERRFHESYEQMVVVGPIDFTSLCEHHVLPFTGSAYVGYLPKDALVGLSKIPRVVQCFAKRLQIQERLTNQIAEAIYRYGDARGAGCVIQARHSCMAIRGVRCSASMITSALYGCFLQEQTVKQEFLDLARGALNHRA